MDLAWVVLFWSLSALVACSGPSAPLRPGAVATGQPQPHDSTPTLDSVRRKGFVQCGVTTGVAGFSAIDQQGQWRGLDVDVCRAVAAAVLGDATKVRFTPLTSAQRFTALQTGEIDLLSRITTITFQRDVQLGIEFPATNWYDGTGFIVRKALQVKSVKDLDGATICIHVPVGLGAVPAILLRVPYGRRTPDMGLDTVGEFFARKGYACVVQDVRGKFSSEGAFDPGVHEVDDGYDTVDWAVEQEWCDGRVGLWGESYYGATSWAAAISGHEAVQCIAPGDIGVDRRGSWFRQGALLLNTTGYWAMAMDGREYADLTQIDPFHLPLADMATAAGLEGRFFAASSIAWRMPTGGGAAGCAIGSARSRARCSRGAGGTTTTSARSSRTTRRCSNTIRAPRPCT